MAEGGGGGGEGGRRGGGGYNTLTKACGIYKCSQFPPTSFLSQPCSEDVVRALEDPEGLEMLTALVNSGARINSPTAVS